MIGHNLLRYNLPNRKFYTFDFEGDLNTNFSTPFQLSFIISTGTKIEKQFDFYLKWKDLNISEFVKKYAHYDEYRMDKHGVPPEEAFEVFSKYIYDPEYSGIGANVLGFDCALAYNCLKRLGMKHDYEFLKRIYDTNALFKLYKLGIKPDNNNLLAQQFSLNFFRQKGLKSNVTYVAKEFGLEIDETRTHDGLYDCEVIKNNFFELIKKIDIE